MKIMYIWLIILIVVFQPVLADVCDYTPSSLIGSGATRVVGASAGGTLATGIGLKAAGIYTFTHATSGVAMLGSTAAGSSAAGTIGIIAGSGGVLGSIGAVVMSPFVIVPAAIVTIGIGAYEGGCYLVLH